MDGVLKGGIAVYTMGRQLLHHEEGQHIVLAQNVLEGHLPTYVHRALASQEEDETNTGKSLGEAATANTNLL